MFESVKTDVFARSAVFESKLPGTAFLMIWYLILEAFGGPCLLTFCFLVAPVTTACMFFGSQLTSLIFSVKSAVEESRNGDRGGLRVVNGRGRRQRRSQRREGEASPPSFERNRITYPARPATS